jgi:hypothetical protein
MTPKPLSPDMFDALMQRAGLNPSPERRARMLEACSFVDEMIARIWTDLPRALEPAQLFVADGATVERSE